MIFIAKAGESVPGTNWFCLLHSAEYNSVSALGAKYTGQCPSRLLFQQERLWHVCFSTLMANSQTSNSLAFIEDVTDLTVYSTCAASK
jgi:hypothetical protein